MGRLLILSGDPSVKSLLPPRAEITTRYCVCSGPIPAGTRDFNHVVAAAAAAAAGVTGAEFYAGIGVVR